LRGLVLWLLHRRGWVHASDQARLRKLLPKHPADEPERPARDPSVRGQNGQAGSGVRPDFPLPGAGY
jgi:hypothetical protein